MEALTKLETVCAWCHSEPTKEIVSHGICPAHAAEMRQEMRELQAAELAREWAGKETKP